MRASDALFPVREAEGVQRLDDGLLLYDNGRGEVPLQVDSLLNFVSASLFGIKRSEVYVAREDFKDAAEEWEYEQAFETSVMDNYDAATFLLEFGLDFTDGRGEPLRCTRFLKLQAEAAAKGYLGHMPDRKTLSLERFASSLEAEAAAFKAKKAAR